MKALLLLLILLTVAGCKQQQAAGSGSAPQTALTQKLQGMTPSQRTEYVKAHMDEVTASAGIPSATHKAP